MIKCVRLNQGANMADDFDDLTDDCSGANQQLDPSITRESFLEWRSPRFGRTNRERMNNPVWEWLIKSKMSAFWAAEKYQTPSAFEAGPGWCFRRFGQSSTTLPDGRVLLIVGEHEDHYDPDFYIYNDLVVRHPDGAWIFLGIPGTFFRRRIFTQPRLLEKRSLLLEVLAIPRTDAPALHR